MVKKISLVDYSKCCPEKCGEGICLAALACPYKVLRQEARYEMPDMHQELCMGCNDCGVACLLNAIRVVDM
jgi:translation initiation factor RLI1